MNVSLDSAAATTRRDGVGDSMPVGLLSPQMLLAAVAGRLRDGPPLALWARELSDLHAELLTHRIAPERGPVGVDHARVCSRVRDTIRAVDEYAAARLSGERGARRCTHSLGEVISYVARTYVEAWWAVRHRTDREHQAWAHLAEVRQGYADLVADLRAGRVRPPRGWCGVDFRLAQAASGQGVRPLR